MSATPTPTIRPLSPDMRRFWKAELARLEEDAREAALAKLREHYGDRAIEKLSPPKR